MDELRLLEMRSDDEKRAGIEQKKAENFSEQSGKNYFFDCLITAPPNPSSI